VPDSVQHVKGNTNGQAFNQQRRAVSNNSATAISTLTQRDD
jgi:hypothetical protein